MGRGISGGKKACSRILQRKALERARQIGASMDVRRQAAHAGLIILGQQRHYPLLGLRARGAHPREPKAQLQGHRPERSVLGGAQGKQDDLLAPERRFLAQPVVASTFQSAEHAIQDDARAKGQRQRSQVVCVEVVPQLGRLIARVVVVQALTQGRDDGLADIEQGSRFELVAQEMQAGDPVESDCRPRALQQVRYGCYAAEPLPLGQLCSFWTLCVDEFPVFAAEVNLVG